MDDAKYDKYDWMIKMSSLDGVFVINCVVLMYNLNGWLQVVIDNYKWI